MKTKNHIPFPSTLAELYQHPGFVPFGSSSDDWINDADRMERCHDAAEYGGDGSTHAEIIGDWREFLSRLERETTRHLCRPRVEREIERRAAYIHAEIDACEDWHEKAGTLNQEIG